MGAAVWSVGGTSDERRGRRRGTEVWAIAQLGELREVWPRIPKRQGVPDEGMLGQKALSLLEGKLQRAAKKQTQRSEEEVLHITSSGPIGITSNMITEEKLSAAGPESKIADNGEEEEISRM